MPLDELADEQTMALAAMDEAARISGLAPREFLERLRDDAPRGSAPEEMDALLQRPVVEGHGVLLGVGVDEATATWLIELDEQAPGLG